MGVGFRDVVFLAVVLGGAGIMGAGLLRPSESPPAQPSKPLAVRSDLQSIVAAVNTSFRDRWAEQRLVPAAPAPELTVMRRLALVLCGSVPSLEEIRRFEAGPKEGRIEAWLDDLLGRPPLRRLPGRAVRSRLCRHRGRAISPVPPPSLHRLVERRALGESPLRLARHAN